MNEEENLLIDLAAQFYINGKINGKQYRLIVESIIDNKEF